jgi:long-chain fatty acid transport protein
MKTLLAVLIIISPFLLNAQGFQVNLQGQREQGMGGAATALATNGSSLFFNPGAVSFLKNNTVSIGVTSISSKVKFVDTTTSTSYTTNSSAGYPFTGNIVLGKKGSKLKFGLATYTPFGSSIKWPEAWAGRFVITSLKLSTIYFQPTVSYKITDKLGLGAGIVYGLGRLNLLSDLPITDEDGNYSSLNLSGKGRGYGFNAGVYFQQSEKLSFGLNYRSALNLKIDKGSATFNVPSTMESSFPSGPVSTTLKLPQVLTLGTAYKASSKLSFAFDATMVGWKSYDTLKYDFENNTSAVADMKLSRHYKNTYSYRIGAEYSITENLLGRLGLKYLNSPIQTGYVTPEVPDANHFSFSTGLGYKPNDHFSFDASFTFEHIKRTDANKAVQLYGTYETYLLMPGISISYCF